MKVKRRILNFLIAFDQFVFSIITLGGSWPDETMSAAAYRQEKNGKMVGRVFRPIIDFLFRAIEKDHCRLSYMSEQKSSHLPVEYLYK